MKLSIPRVCKGMSWFFARRELSSSYSNGSSSSNVEVEYGGGMLQERGPSKRSMGKSVRFTSSFFDQGDL